MKLLFALLLLVLSASVQAQYDPRDPRSGYDVYGQGEYARPDNCYSAYGCNTVIVIPPPRPLPPPYYGHRPPHRPMYPAYPAPYYGRYPSGYGNSGYGGSIGLYNNGYNNGVSGSFYFYKNH